MSERDEHSPEPFELTDEALDKAFFDTSDFDQKVAETLRENEAALGRLKQVVGLQEVLPRSIALSALSLDDITPQKINYNSPDGMWYDFLGTLYNVASLAVMYESFEDGMSNHSKTRSLRTFLVAMQQYPEQAGLGNALNFYLQLCDLPDHIQDKIDSPQTLDRELAFERAIGVLERDLEVARDQFVESWTPVALQLLTSECGPHDAAHATARRIAKVAYLFAMQPDRPSTAVQLQLLIRHQAHPNATPIHLRALVARIAHCANPDLTLNPDG